MSQVRVVLSTAPDQATGESLGRTLVEERLAACVNVVPGVVSLYRWDQELRRDAEVLLVMKTTEGSVDALKERVATLHPYEVPELLVLSVADGLSGYLEWVGTEVSVS